MFHTICQFLARERVCGHIMISGPGMVFGHSLRGRIVGLQHLPAVLYGHVSLKFISSAPQRPFRWFETRLIPAILSGSAKLLFSTVSATAQFEQHANIEWHHQSFLHPAKPCFKTSGVHADAALYAAHVHPPTANMLHLRLKLVSRCLPTWRVVQQGLIRRWGKHAGSWNMPVPLGHVFCMGAGLGGRSLCNSAPKTFVGRRSLCRTVARAQMTKKHLIQNRATVT